ncbi:MAG: Gldg family protein [Planctomycetota bacterium]
MSFLRRFGVWLNLLVGALLLLTVWALLVWVASRPTLKALIDMTPQSTNSVDPATIDLLAELRGQQAEIEFHLFYVDTSRFVGQSDVQRAQVRIRRRLVDLTRMLLKRYEYLGAEAVTVVEHEPYGDPKSYSEAAQKYGYNAQDGESLVVAVAMPEREQRHRKLSLLSDLAVIDMPRSGVPGAAREPVPILKDYQGEQAISSTLKSLLVQGTPVAYVLKGMSPTVDYGVTSNYGYGVFLQSLEQLGFEVQELNLREARKVPPDAALVIVLEPKREFVPRDANALFEYVRGGGRVFVNYTWTPGVADMNPIGGRFGELLGYELSERPVFHLIPSGQRTGGTGLDGNDAVMQLPLQINRSHPTTRRIAESGQALELFMARELREAKGAPAGVQREPLLMTGPNAWLAVPDGNGQMDNRRPRGIQLRPKIVGMACSVEQPAVAPATKPAGRPGQVVVVSGVCCNNAAMQLFGSFAVNVCNWMAERRVLLDIAGSSYEVRYLDVKPPQLQRAFWLLVAYVPGAFFVLGMIVWWRRRH